MKIATVQMDCIPGDIPANVAKICQIVKRVKPVDLIVFPELINTGYIMSEMQRYTSHPGKDQTIDQLSKAAFDKKVSIIVGLAEREDEKIYNVAVLIGPDGIVRAKYRKIHLYLPSGEAIFSAGDEITTVIIGGFKVGLMICYDTRFPEMARTLAIAGAELIITPTAWPFPRMEHWQLLSRARAIENQCYFVGANRVGKDGNAIFCGNSRVIDPHGVVIAAASEDQEDILYAEIKKEKLEFIRNRMPVFEHRRPDVYRI